MKWERTRSMARLLCILVCLVLLNTGGLPAHSFGSGQNGESHQIVTPEEKTWTDSDYDNAEIALQSALLATEGDFSKQLPILQALADTFHERRKYEEEKAVLLALIMVIHSIDDYPIVPLAAQHLRLSTVYFRLEDYKNAASFAQVAVELFKKSCGEKSTNLALALNNLGWIELKLGSLDSARDHFEKSISIVGKNVGKKSLLYGLIAENLAALYTQKEDHQSAFVWYRTSLKTLGRYLAEDDPAAIDILRRCNLARSLSRATNKQHIGSSKSKKRLACENKSHK